MEECEECEENMEEASGDWRAQEERMERLSERFRGLPPFIDLITHDLAFPFWYTLGPMHLHFKNEIPHTLALFFGKKHSCQHTPLIPKDKVLMMDK